MAVLGSPPAMCLFVIVRLSIETHMIKDYDRGDRHVRFAEIYAGSGNRDPKSLLDAVRAADEQTVGQGRADNAGSKCSINSS